MALDARTTVSPTFAMSGQLGAVIFSGLVNVMSNIHVMLYAVSVCILYFRYRGRAIGNRYGAGSGTIWLDDVHCRGIETSIALCRHGGWNTHNCAHAEDVSVSCGTTAPVQFGYIISTYILYILFAVTLQ